MGTETLADDFLALWRLIRRTTHPVRRAEVTAEQYWLLKMLERKGACTMGDLAASLGISASSVTIACKRLEKAGFLTRDRQQRDERVVKVDLTDHGRDQLQVWVAQRKAALASLLTPLSDDERQLLQDMLQRVLAAAEATSEAGIRAARHDPVPL